MQATSKKNFNLGLICLALTIITVIVFFPVKDCGFISLDDNIYVYENMYIQYGFNWDSIRNVFSFELPKTIGHWHPVTWLSLMLDYSVFGLNPVGYHLVNLLLHVMNTILLFLILRRMTKALWPSAFVAVLFAIHPLHVESIAWITERKDVLSTFFWMLTLGAYSYYVEHREFKRYFFVLLFFILGLMSKPMLVTLPFVLLLLDYWPLQRFSEVKPVQEVQGEILKPAVSGKQKKKSGKKDTEKGTVKEAPEVRKPAEPEFKWSLIYPLILEKIPLFVLAIFSSIAAYLAAHTAGAVESIDTMPLSVRIANAFVSYMIYIGKMILPINLAVLYPHSEAVVLWQVGGAVILLTAVTAAVSMMLKKAPYLATGWLWYMGTLVPVIGIVQAGSQAMADRYTYIPLIGLFIIVAWGVPELLKKWSYRKEILITASALCILCFSILTWIQVGYWRDSLTLFDYTLKVTKNNWFIHNSRGVAYSILGDYRQASEDYSRTITLNPKFPSAYYNRCIACNNLGNYRQALEDCGRAIQLKPAYAEAYMNRGNAYSGLGDYSKAFIDYDKAIQLNGMYAEAYYNRGIAFTALGKYGQAIADYDCAVKIKPNHADAYNNRGAAYYGLGNYSKAIENYSRAIEVKPDFTGAYYNRGVAYVKLDKKDLAVQDLKISAKLGGAHAREVLKRNGISW